ncbi:MAG: CvpA family protein [Oscillospiraceae bacterium]|nr:CvpA family protein [Oscillospiraceae bacterium]
MDNAIITDLILAAFLLVGVLFGAKRGLFQSLVGLVIVIAALVGATAAASALTGPLTDLVYPRVEESVIARLLPDEVTAAMQEESAQETQDDGILARYRRVLEKGVKDAANHAIESTINALRESAHRLVEAFVHALVFLLAFLTLMLVLRLAARGLEHVLELPGLHALNAIGGGALGLIEGTLLVFLILSLAPKLGITWFSEQEEGTHLLAFFLNNTPHTLLQMLTR